MTLDQECPIDVVEEALRLGSYIEVRDIPLDFDPGDRRWKETLAIIAAQFSNHGTLLDRLDDFLAQAQTEHEVECDLAVPNSEGSPCAGCAERRLAEYRLREAALGASEKAYQRWLARQALRRAGDQDA